MQCSQEARPGSCRNVAGYKTSHVGYGHCVYHGGASPGGTKAAERQRAEDGARRFLEREELLPVDDPVRQLQLLAAEILRLKDLLGDMVNELPSLTFSDASGREDLRAVLGAFEIGAGPGSQGLAGDGQA